MFVPQLARKKKKAVVLITNLCFQPQHLKLWWWKFAHSSFWYILGSLKSTFLRFLNRCKSQRFT